MQHLNQIVNFCLQKGEIRIVDHLQYMLKISLVKDMKELHSVTSDRGIWHASLLFYGEVRGCKYYKKLADQNYPLPLSHSKLHMLLDEQFFLDHRLVRIYRSEDMVYVESIQTKLPSIMEIPGLYVQLGSSTNFLQAYQAMRQCKPFVQTFS